MAQLNDRVESDAYDTPTETVARSLPELQVLLTRPRAAGEPLTVRLVGPAAAQILGEGPAVRVAAAVTEEVTR